MKALKLTLTALAIALASLTSVASSDAQEARGRTETNRSDPTFQLTQQQLMLLMHKPVQDELKLSPEQQSKLPEFRLNLYKKGPPASIPSNDYEVRQLAWREYAEAIEAGLKGLLSMEQHKRLKQLSLQASAASDRGLVGLLRDPEVAKTIGITEVQQEGLSGIRKEHQEAYNQFLTRGFGRDDLPRTQTTLREASDRKVMGLLTDAQKAKWKEMIGAEFKFKSE